MTDISLERFLGRITVTKAVTVEVENGIYQTRLMNMAPTPRTEPLSRVGFVTLFQADYCSSYTKNAAERLAHGPLILARVGAENAGFLHPGMLYILPTFRGLGIGPEMLVHLFLLDGPEVWLARPRHLTAAGLQTHIRAYNLLQARGLL